MFQEFYKRKILNEKYFLLGLMNFKNNGFSLGKNPVNSSFRINIFENGMIYGCEIK